MNFTRDAIECAPSHARALVELARDGSRREWTFGELAERCAGLRGRAARARRPSRRRGAHADREPARVGNRHARLLPPGLRRPALHRAAAREGPRAAVGDRAAADRRRRPPQRGPPRRPRIHLARESAPAPPPAELGPEDPCLITFTSGTSGEPKAVLHGQRYLTGQQLQAEHWLAPEPGDLVWCTAASGWSKSARNAFIAPWLRGAAALLHDARFDPHERLELVARERVDVLCMAPTEYRVIAKRATLSGTAAQGPGRRRRGAQPRGPARLARGDRPVDPRRLRADRDRPADRLAARRDARARARWAARCQASSCPSSTANWSSTPCHRPHVLRPLPRRGAAHRSVAHRRPRDRRRGRLPVLRGPHRRRDHLRRLPDRARSRSNRRWSRTRRWPRPPWSPRPTTSADRSCGRSSSCATATRRRTRWRRRLQDHVKGQTAPYKYPRIVDFAADLPKTPSGKVRRAALRGR